MAGIERETLKLYIVTDRTWLGKKPLWKAVEEAILGGATLVQYREKHLTGERFEEQSVRRLPHRKQAQTISDAELFSERKRKTMRRN